MVESSSAQRDKARWFAGLPLAGITLLQLWVLLFEAGADLDLSSRLALLPFSILMLFSPLILAWVILYVSRQPWLSLTVTLPSGAVFLYVYYVEFLKPYQGGGASMLYAVAWLYALGASALCFFSFRLYEKFCNR